VCCQYLLNHEDVAFYIEKLTVDGVQLPDPYGIAKSCWVNDVNKWPDISYPDIYQYFVETTIIRHLESYLLVNLNNTAPSIGTFAE
jgi:hypothetical protein